MTLYEQNPEAWKRLHSLGRVSLCEMAKHVHSTSEMDEALGLDGAAHKWARGLNGASSKSEKLARDWLASQTADASAPANGAVTFLCLADAATAAKAEKVLRLLGCEVVEV